MTTPQYYALITGAESGIGREIAKLLVKDEYNIVIVGRNLERLEETAAELGLIKPVKIIPLAKDLSVRGAAFELYDQVKARGVQINILVNDAGQGLSATFVKTEIQHDLDVIQQNISSLVVLTKLFIKDMIARKEGKVLNLLSFTAKVPSSLQPLYHGIKAFVQSFTEATQEEVKEAGVLITALLPGVTKAGFIPKDKLFDSNRAGDYLSDPVVVAKDGYDAIRTASEHYA